MCRFCKSILELGRARARRMRCLPKPLSRMRIPARHLNAEHDSISSAIYQTAERILQQNLPKAVLPLVTTAHQLLEPRVERDQSENATGLSGLRLTDNEKMSGRA
jgi:hypothetical protein